ncbi:MAG: FAD-dependent oxidoreductase [Gordonia sp. (in: high G+C Gram-positive bacteria)]
MLLSRGAGRIRSERTLRLMEEQARLHGADLRPNHRVTSIVSGGDGVAVTALDPQGRAEVFRADGVVVTAGAWTERLLGDQVRLPELVVTEEHPAHFQPAAECRDARWPSFNHLVAAGEGLRKGDVYGMFTPGEGVKVGFHGTGPRIDPDRRTFAGTEQARRDLADHVARWFPGLDPGSAAEISCTYTTTTGDDFVMDRRGAITIGAGFKGEGFKFVPAVGQLLADLALGEAESPEVFRLPG